VNGYGKGDLLVKVHVWIPQKLTAEERRIMEKLQECTNFQGVPEEAEKSFFERMRDIFD
jgi:molecular chaperone DnaJ